MKRLWFYYIYLILVWGSFRYFVRLPEVIEELWFKPVLWLVPLFWWNLAIKDRVEMFGNKWGRSVSFGLIAGLFYFFLLRFGKIGSISIDIELLGLALATAVTEELTFSGFIAGYLEKIHKGKWFNSVLVGLMTAVIRLPILLFVYQANGREVFGVLLVVFASGVINAVIRVKSGSVTGSMVARWFMNLATLS